MSSFTSYIKSITTASHLLMRIFFIFSAFTMMVVFSYAFMRSIVEKHLNIETQNSLENLERAIIYDLKESEAVVNTIAVTVKSMLANGDDADQLKAYIKYITDEILADGRNSTGFITAYAMFDIFGGTGYNGLGWEEVDNYVPEECPWFTTAEAANGKVGVTEPYLDVVTREVSISFARCLYADYDIYDRNGELLAVKGEKIATVCIDVMLDRIRSFQDYIYQYEGSNYRVLFDKGLNVIAHPNTELIGLPMRESSSILADFADEIEYKGYIMSGKGSNYENRESILCVKSIANGWYVCVISPVDEYFKDLSDIQLFLIVFGLAFALILCLILVAVDRTRANAVEETTKLTNLSRSLDEQVERQALMAAISQSFLTHEDTDVLTTNAFRMIGEFMGVSLILLYVADDSDNNNFICQNEWLNPKFNMPSRIGHAFPVSEGLTALFTGIKDRHSSCLTSDDPAVREVMAPYRIHFRKYLTSPIFFGGKICAVLDYSWTDDGGPCSDDDINMTIFISNILTGVFHRRSVENQLVVAKEQAENSNRSKSIFLASMSHEIRTPMNAILGMAEIQLQNKELTADIEEAFTIIYDSGNLLINIINDILDFSKIEAGKLDINYVNYDIPSIINDTVQLIRLRYESKPLEFKLTIDPNTPLLLFGDELRIKQVLNNLLSNAFKYTDRGTVELLVYPEDIDEQDDDEVMLVFRVSDTGQGMRKDQLERLYDEYTRFNLNTNRTTVGTGLGMSITKSLVGLMNGKIKVESEPGKGTVFTIYLPQKRVGESICGAEVEKNLRLDYLHQITKLNKMQFMREYMPYGKVLIVDDVWTNLYVAKGLLLPYGLNVETVVNGTDAIEKIRNGNIYDVIFMDHMMPQMDGVEVTKILRDMGYDRAIIALTANAISGQSDMFLSNGFDGFISKPIDMRELNAILNNFIRDRQSPEVIAGARREKNQTIVLEQQTYIPTEEVQMAFLSDAEKIISVLDDTLAKINSLNDEDIRLYVISVHGIKNALDAIGENDISTLAYKLERAGRENNMATVSDETPILLGKLRALTRRMKKPHQDQNIIVDHKDILYLCEKMVIIKDACAVFDNKTAKSSVEELKCKTWSQEIMKDLDAISRKLLHSAFNDVSNIAQGVIIRYSN